MCCARTARPLPYRAIFLLPTPHHHFLSTEQAENVNDMDEHTWESAESGFTVRLSPCDSHPSPVAMYEHVLSIMR